MRGYRRAIAKVLILVPAAVLAAAFAIGPGQLVSYTPATRLGVHCMMAFWISIPVALSVLSYQRNQIRTNTLIMSALVFPMVVHIGSAVRNLLRIDQGPVERVLVDTVADFFELAMFAFLLACAVVSIVVSSDERPMQGKLYQLVLLLTLPLALFGITWFILTPILTQAMLVPICWILGTITFLSFLLIFVLLPKLKAFDTPIDLGYFTSALLLIVFAVVSLLMSLENPTMNWEYAETLQMASFVLLAISLGVPFLKRAGFNRRSAYSIILGLILMAYFPFLITIVIESMGAVLPSSVPNPFAYTIIHVGAASLSAMMAILLYVYPKRKTSWNHYPLIGLFGMWCGIAIFQVVLLLFPLVAPLGEPVTPYNVGGILTLVLLYITAIWTRKHPTDRSVPSLWELLVTLSGLMVCVVAGEGINQLVLSLNPDLSGHLSSNVMILVTNLFIMFAFAYIIFLLAEDSEGEAPVELYVVLFLAMWILPNILRSYYTLWTAGWWISEILLFIGLLAGTPIFTWLYVQTMHQVEDSHKRANMYADLLMHDISNYNQMMMMSLELLGSSEISEEQRSRLSEDGRQVISFSEQLISNVRLLSEADRLETDNLHPTNLVTTIVSALDVFTRRIGSGELVVEFHPEESEAFVMANELLAHIFLNIHYSALECRKRGETVTIGIHEIESSGEKYWEIDIKAPGRSADQEEGYSSGTLGLLAAQLMTESLNGSFEMESFARTDICEGRFFTIRLHSSDG
ncbi:MAG: hypothetical protein ACFFE1_13210 [Candidatus Thorarchaeota archaeon]